jgi:hypothetical protein
LRKISPPHCLQQKKERRLPLLVSGALAGLKPFEGFFQSAVHKVGIDLGGRYVPVPQGTLYDQQVIGGAVQMGCESVTQPMRRQVLIDARFFQPVADSI